MIQKLIQEINQKIVGEIDAKINEYKEKIKRDWLRVV